MKSVNKNVSTLAEHNGKYPCPINDINISEAHLEVTSRAPPHTHTHTPLCTDYTLHSNHWIHPSR